MSRRILITGARDWADREVVVLAIRDAVDWSVGGETVVVHGACPTGADAIADVAVGELQAAAYFANCALTVERHPADWDAHGKAAGPRRNQEMVDLGADICLAFVGKSSRGTVHCAGAAEAAGIPVRRWYA